METEKHKRGQGMINNEKRRKAALAESGDPSVVSSTGQDINYKNDSNSRNIAH